MSNKIIKLTPEQQKQRDDESYLKGRPNRLEVANYVNSLLENEYLPRILNTIRISAMVLQSILIEKGICTGEEIESITKEFVERQEQEIANQSKESEQK